MSRLESRAQSLGTALLTAQTRALEFLANRPRVLRQWLDEEARALRDPALTPPPRMPGEGRRSPRARHPQGHRIRVVREGRAKPTRPRVSRRTAHEEGKTLRRRLSRDAGERHQPQRRV